MGAILVSGDLMIGSQVRGAAEPLGIEVTTVAALDDVVEHAADADVVVVDLSGVTGGLKRVVDAVRQGENPDCRFVAFAPHVHRQKLTAARDAGCDEVLSRGQFHAHLDRVLRGEPIPGESHDEGD